MAEDFVDNQNEELLKTDTELDNDDNTDNTDTDIDDNNDSSDNKESNDGTIDDNDDEYKEVLLHTYELVDYLTINGIRIKDAYKLNFIYS